MAIDKSLLTGSTTLLVLKLLDGKDMYGYQMIEELEKRSDYTFELKAGTLYPILHGLEEQEIVSSYDDNVVGARTRKYYHLTGKGKKLLNDKRAEWEVYTNAVNRVLKGGAQFATV
ncbi:MAG: PadR family transcriptional regulator [Clostridia bacterium]|nr:PadR family transcriptional regulator [Clostridia bacterium]